jgi:predicted metal-dependent phosphotriesterase family hydrolase
MTDDQLLQATEFIADMTAAEVGRRYAKCKKLSTTEGIRLFMATKTYSLLVNPESYLALESVEYVLDMLKAELSGDLKRWLKI